MSTNALILSGGGARASYQVGVLQAIADIVPDIENPFPIICGTSAGAINAAAIAANPAYFKSAAYELANLWKTLEVEDVFKTGWKDVITSASLVLASFLNEGVGRRRPVSLLDNSPLRNLINSVISFDNIQKKIDSGALEALSITALGYTSGESVSFFQGNDYLRGWRRYRRVGAPTKLTVEHLLASSAIPAVFPTIKLSKEYFGDGAMRQMAPISPALHLGADRIFIIGVSGNRNPDKWKKSGYPRPKHSPSLAQILGQMFNASFIDALEGDIEHLERVNDLLALVNEEKCENTNFLRPVERLIISPSKSLEKIAGRNIRNLPKPLRLFLRSTGATTKGGGAAVASFLLFNSRYCSELIDLGYQDAMWEREAIEQFFAGSEAAKNGEPPAN